MKKIILTILFVCMLCTSVFALDGVVVDVLGKVEKQKGDSWVALNKGDKLAPGDVVSTGFKSEAVLSVGESKVVVKALTRMTVEQLYEKNDNHVTSVYVDVGAISADVKAVENKRVGFTVKTPAVTASVRGTEGNVYAYGKVESTRGTWAIMPPQPKSISLDRGDAAPAETAESDSGTAAVTDVSQGGAVAGNADADVEAALQANTSETEVTVPAGEVAQVSASNPGVIETPMQLKESNAKGIAGGQAKLSDKETISTSPSPAPATISFDDLNTSQNNGMSYGSLTITLNLPNQSEQEGEAGRP